MIDIVKSVFGDKKSKDVKRLWPIVDEIKAEYEKIKNLTDDELKAKTEEFKEKIQTFTEETRKEIEQALQQSEEKFREIYYGY